MRATLKNIWKTLSRTKQIDLNLDESALKRCLTTFDLTALGIGSTLGLGIYVLAGQVASQKAGPAVCLSFLIAAMASVFAGLCYAEFGARVPKAGSAYVYSYVTVGEFMAFIIGWNLILEYVIGTASVARGYSGYIDSLFNGTIGKHLEQVAPMYLSGLSNYPDFLALGITLFLTTLLAVGVKESSRFNNIFTMLNLSVVIFTLIAGSIKADGHNWNIDTSKYANATDKIGKGGFFPFGVSGMMSGAATCFYGFVGFDSIATTGEEVKNPQKSIPISIVLSLIIVFLSYFGVSAVQTLMVPYYLQNQPAPLPYVFTKVGWPWASWIITVGALAGLSTSLLGGTFPLPRVLYAMATDGVIFRFLSTIHPRLKTPLIATILSGIFIGCMAMLFDVKELADMMSIGTLLAYTLVAISVLVLRYKCSEAVSGDKICQKKKGDTYDSSKTSQLKEILLEILGPVVNLKKKRQPTKHSERICCSLIAINGGLVVALDIVLVVSQNHDTMYSWPVICVSCILAFLVLVFLVVLSRQPVSDKTLSFQVPFVPFVPFLSVFANIYLMCNLPIQTWKRFGVWMLIGFCVYFFYGCRNSTEGKRQTTSATLSSSPFGEVKIPNKDRANIYPYTNNELKEKCNKNNCTCEMTDTSNNNLNLSNTDL